MLMLSCRKDKHPDTWAVEKKRRQWLMENRGQDPPDSYVMPCHLCDSFTTTRLGDLRDHWAAEHPGLTDRPSNANMKEGGFPGTCDVCGQGPYSTETFGLIELNSGQGRVTRLTSHKPKFMRFI